MTFYLWKRLPTLLRTLPPDAYLLPVFCNCWKKPKNISKMELTLEIIQYKNPVLLVAADLYKGVWRTRDIYPLRNTIPVGHIYRSWTGRCEEMMEGTKLTGNQRQHDLARSNRTRLMHTDKNVFLSVNALRDRIVWAKFQWICILKSIFSNLYCRVISTFSQETSRRILIKKSRGKWHSITNDVNCSSYLDLIQFC